MDFFCLVAIIVITFFFFYNQKPIANPFKNGVLNVGVASKDSKLYKFGMLIGIVHEQQQQQNNDNNNNNHNEQQQFPVIEMKISASPQNNNNNNYSQPKDNGHIPNNTQKVTKQSAYEMFQSITFPTPSTISSHPPKKSDEYIIDFLDVLQAQTGETIFVDRTLAVKVLELALTKSSSSKSSAAQELEQEQEFDETESKTTDQLDTIIEQLQMINQKIAKLENKVLCNGEEGDDNNNYLNVE